MIGRRSGRKSRMGRSSVSVQGVRTNGRASSRNLISKNLYQTWPLDWRPVGSIFPWRNRERLTLFLQNNAKTNRLLNMHVLYSTEAVSLDRYIQQHSKMCPQNKASNHNSNLLSDSKSLTLKPKSWLMITFMYLEVKPNMKLID